MTRTLTRRRLAVAGAVAAVVSLAAAPALAGSGPFAARTTSQLALTSYTQQVAPLGHFGGVTVTADAFGSAVAAVPGSGDQVWGLTDRGPNVDGPDGSKIEPIPSFTPALGRFVLRHGKARLVQTVPLRAADGTPYNGQVNSQASTGEVITDLDGKVLPSSPYGYDSEGLVALKDGSFWISDEYGPFITHFDRRGRTIERLSPFDASLPRELALRTPNRGMEGLAITPDGRTLVGIVQSALTQTDISKPKDVSVVRIVTVDLRTRATHEYAYVLDHPAETGTAVSEIAALSATEFIVDERDGDFGPGAYKKLWQIDLARATDIGPSTSIGHYDGSHGGLLVGGRTVEAIAGKGTVEDTTTALQQAGITPVTRSLYLDLGALVSATAPDGSFYAHDKIEGLAILNGGRKIIISNDSDFGLAASTGGQAPFGLVAKTQPNGAPDDGQFLVITRG